MSSGEKQRATVLRFTRLTEPLPRVDEGEIEEGAGELRRYLDYADQAFSTDDHTLEQADDIATPFVGRKAG
jgi:hypothetical protein